MIYVRAKPFVGSRIDIVILWQFLARVLRGLGVHQGNLPKNMEVSEWGGAVIKPSRPVTATIPCHPAAQHTSRKNGTFLKLLSRGH